MRVVKSLTILLLGVFLIISCSEESKFIKPSNTSIQYNGRIDFSNVDKPMLTWAGSSIKIKFKGTGLKVLLQNKYGNCNLNIVIDNDNLFILQIDSTKNWYKIASNLEKKEHTIEVFKRINNNDFWFYGFELDDNSELLKLPKREKIIEFIGDSITHGSSIYDTLNDNWRGLNSDNYFTYGAVTARYFNAQYYCIAQGGVGLMVGGNRLIMDELYYRLNIRDADSKWDFSKVQPNIVVINLFQNDCGVIDKPNHPQFIKRFGKDKPSEKDIINAYIKFVQNKKDNYPNAKIICSLGSMSAAREDLPWARYIKKAVDKMNNPNIYFCLFPYKNSSGHPEVKDHKAMANILINFIKKNNI